MVKLKNSLLFEVFESNGNLKTRIIKNFMLHFVKYGNTNRLRVVPGGDYTRALSVSPLLRGRRQISRALGLLLVLVSFSFAITEVKREYSCSPDEERIMIVS